ncbi:hypothetical protein CSB09_00805 [Candidatus Gracilibacteria bacterium]|nr:MAG: hypothetical protein CSB09_00805 [Candidatus Gracilibacteria bacterium]
MQFFTKYFLHFLLFFGVFLLSACVPQPKDTQEEIDYLTGDISGSGIEIDSKAHQITIDEAEKVRLALQRKQQISTIRKGDYMIAKNQPKQALGYYLFVLKKIPDDIVLLRKIAHSYFLLKDWKNAYSFYIRVPRSELSDAQRDEMFKSLFYQKNQGSTKKELDTLAESLPKEALYYSTLHPCFSGENACRRSINAYKGGNEKLTALKKILKDVDYVSPTTSYRQFRLAVGLYEQNMYHLSSLFAGSLLKNNPSYTEAKKLQGFSLYELGRYEAAKKILLSYLDNDSEDLEVIIRLGEIFTYQEDYNQAILYLNNAINAGYKPKTLLERRLAYNYAKLDDLGSMEKVLSYLMQEEDATEDDFAVAISLALSKKQYTKAYAWSYEGLQRFNGSKILIPLYLQSTRLSHQLSDGERYLETLTPEVRALPLVRLEEAILRYEKSDLEGAKQIFQSLVDFDAGADFGIESKEYLDRINLEEIAHSYESSGTTNDDSYEFDPDFWK